jgi:hypothetical protein
MQRTSSIIVILIVATAALVAQKKPDFSGSWTLDPSRSEMGGGGPGGGGPGRGPGGGGPSKLVVKQTDATLTIEREMGGETVTQTYKLDGSESVNRGMRGGEVKSKSRWDGDKLVTEGSQSMNTPGGDMTIQTKEIRSMAADGTMVVETTRTTPRGTTTSKLVFTKTT